MRAVGTFEGAGASANTHGAGLDPFTLGFVRKSSRQLAGQMGIQDREDVEQELFLKLVGRLDAADPDHPRWKAFVAKTVRRHVLSLIRHRLAQKRDHRRCRSLHATTDREDGSMALAETVEGGDIPSGRGRSCRSIQEQAELALDVADCLASIDDERHREFCDRLKHDSISRIARDMKIPRTTLNSWISRLRRRFEERGLDAYLGAHVRQIDRPRSL